MPPAKKEQINTISKNNLPVVDENIDSVSKSTFHYLKKHRIEVLAIVCLTVIIEALVVFSKAQDIRAYIYPLFIPFIGYFHLKSKVEDEFMQQFAQANDYAYEKVGKYGKGYLFKLGHSNRATDQVGGQYNGYPIQLYLYSYTIGYGRNSHTYNHTVFSLEFNTAMPDVILTTKGRWLRNEFLVPSGMFTMKLEGDFNNYFSLHVQKGYELEALEVFTPDVMAKLIDKARSLNLEIFQNSLCIYSDGFVQTKEKLYAMYELARYLTGELGPVLANMKPSLEATEEFKKDIAQT